MSVCSGRGIVSDSTSASGDENRHSSTRVACSEKIAKLTPRPSQVAPSGYGDPGQTRSGAIGTVGLYCSGRSAKCEVRSGGKQEAGSWKQEAGSRKQEAEICPIRLTVRL